MLKNSETKIFAHYDRMAQAVRLKLLDHYPAKLIWGVLADTRQELKKLEPRIPQVGVKDDWQIDLHTSAMILAMYRTLSRHYFTFPEAARLIRIVAEAYLLGLPRPVRWAYRWQYFSPWRQNRLRQSAEASHLRRYPQDWVFTFVDGDGLSFDVGLDVSECAILKFYRLEGAEELVPQLCKLEHAIGKILGLGLSRQGTLAEGAVMCDGRWKRGAETPGWKLAYDDTIYEY